jgi:homoaconitase/3-isopropylmalate dehydratase large subunit
MNMVALADLYDAPINPASLNFTTKPGRACRNCLFQRQRVSVCNKAVELALLAGLANCDQEDVIYILREVDPRQMVIEE